MVTAQLQHAEEGQVVGRHEQFVHVGVSNVDPAQVRVLDQEQQDLRADARYQDITLLAGVQRCCE